METQDSRVEKRHAKSAREETTKPNGGLYTQGTVGKALAMEILQKDRKPQVWNLGVTSDSGSWRERCLHGDLTT